MKESNCQYLEEFINKDAFHTLIGEDSEGNEIYQSNENESYIYTIDYDNCEYNNGAFEYYQKDFEFRLKLFGIEFVCNESHDFNEFMGDLESQADEKEDFFDSANEDEFWSLFWAEVKRSLEETYPELDLSEFGNYFE